MRGRVLLGITFFLIAVISVLAIFLPGKVSSGPYLDSAHANAVYGVSRQSVAALYPKGHCGHCHEQHASIGGAEPDPVGGAERYALFSTSYVNLNDSFCLKCHTDLNAQQLGGVVNRSYSFRAGGWSTDLLNDIQEAFTNPPSISSHYLDDVRTFIASKWNYTADSNPCSACHNVHMLQGDPPNAINGLKTAGSRGWPASRPAMHDKNTAAWGLWGDNTAAERMNIYAPGGYQAPYRYNSTTAYEPDGSGTIQDGSNLADYATLCSDCHNNTNIIYSTPLGRNLYRFDWSFEMHGRGSAQNTYPTSPELKLPYTDARLGSYVLACTDCHEPHGSPNNFLIRKIVNGGIVTVTQNGAGLYPYSPPWPASQQKPGREWMGLCERCHDNVLYEVTGQTQIHLHPLTILGDPAGGCSSSRCHPFDSVTGEPLYKHCTNCHFHGNNMIDGQPYGKQLF